MSSSKAAAIWIEGTELPLDSIREVIARSDLELAAEYVLLQAFERRSPPATLVVLPLDELRLSAARGFVLAPPALAKHFGRRTWRLWGFAGRYNSFLEIEAFAASGDRTWTEQGATHAPFERLRAEATAPDGCLALRERAFLQPDDGWIPRERWRVGVPSVPWTAVAPDPVAEREHFGADVPLDPGGRWKRERRLGDGLHETQYLVPLVEDADSTEVLSQLGTDRSILHPVGVYGLDAHECPDGVPKPLAAATQQLTLGTSSSLICVVMKMPGALEWLVATKLHGPPSDELRAMVAGG